MRHIGTGQKTKRTLKPQEFEASQYFKFEIAEGIGEEHEVEDRYSPEDPFQADESNRQGALAGRSKPFGMSKVNTRTAKPRR